ncbi:hypothetical protein OOT33_13750 [Sphingobium sp. DEHP117]|uniref:hypothetical protein n=1 Tax=Sphingobium sp. DEHP117 TaxID=2993436 RepID=UPI0027D656A3|nr:hypothetical protein [Sphingobium sp. DEHP117]MDQ4421487.1 hypothetical protein [Sphingobium sp. DEHP117]
MPALLLRYLPHIGIVCAVLFGVWWIYDSGHDAAERAADARTARLTTRVLVAVRDVEARAIARENRRSAQDRATLATIAANTAAGDARIIKEMTHEVRYTDPALGYPPGVRAEINRALAALACASTDRGGISCAVLKTDPTPDP